MGQEISKSAFSEAEHEEYRARLRSETAILKRWFDERAFSYDEIPTTGLEMEAWLVDEDFLPAPRNAEFIEALADPDVVTELSKFNFELNAPPQVLDAEFLERTHRGLEHTWKKCTAKAGELGLGAIAAGILPTVRDEMLQLEWMSDSERYRALNDEIFRIRSGELLHIKVDGEDRLEYRCDHIMLEAACTSLQAHLKVNQEEAARFYNASLITAGPMLAVSANSPYLYGKSLWDETRIAAFEQATSLHGFVDVEGRRVKRVTLGTGYLRRSMLELFVENLSYPALLPELSDKADNLPHLRLHNGTVWRWIRPIAGFDPDGTPHLRIEQRVMPAGPTLVDSIANLALYYGLALALARTQTPPEDEIPFEEARANFYACAQKGLQADISWGGKRMSVQSLLLERLTPLARAALAKAGVGAAALDYYFDGVLRPRLISGLNGARWQRSFVECNGADFQAMLMRYAELQAGGRPVAEWTV
ncbi:MAG: glutamate-cysteine ligase family protein [Parvularculaceae bacterium]